MANDKLKGRFRQNLALAFFHALLGLAFLPSVAQQTSLGSDPFYNINLGFGMPYGGLGLNGEYGKGHISFHAGFGYALRNKTDTIVIEDSWNWQVGARYYINVNSEVVFPRIGISYGWITNYYADRIGNTEYDQNVTGFSVHIGSQFYTLEGLVISVDLTGSSRVFIANVGTHPYFFDVYIRPAVGIGVDLHSLFSRGGDGKKIRNRAIDPFG